MLINACPELLQVPQILDPFGSIGVIEPRSMGLPFVVERVYYLHNLAPLSQRGGHAHKALYQLILAMSGSFTIELDDGRKFSEIFTLESPRTGILIPPGYWRDIKVNEPNSVLLVLASAEYDEADYLRTYDDFLEWKSNCP